MTGDLDRLKLVRYCRQYNAPLVRDLERVVSPPETPSILPSHPKVRILDIMQNAGSAHLIPQLSFLNVPGLGRFSE